MFQAIRCIVVDDDFIDRKTAISYLKGHPFIQICGEYDSPLEALEAARVLQPDALFLDIDMPGMNGLRLREQLLHVPACIFITSYPDYAVESFDMAALDFLVKPFAAERFAQTISRLNDYLTLLKKSELLTHTLGADAIFIKEGSQQVKLHLHEILYLEALRDYTGVITATRKYMVLSPLGTLLKEKGFSSFIRIHRSYAVQKNYIKRIMPGEVLINTIVLPVGRVYKDALKAITL